METKLALKVNTDIYLQNMSIKRRLARIDQTRVFSVGFFCVCSLSASIINYTCPNFLAESKVVPFKENSSFHLVVL
jgi:hypothetical protein